MKRRWIHHQYRARCRGCCRWCPTCVRLNISRVVAVSMLDIIPSAAVSSSLSRKSLVFKLQLTKTSVTGIAFSSDRQFLIGEGLNGPCKMMGQQGNHPSGSSPELCICVIASGAMSHVTRWHCKFLGLASFSMRLDLG